MALVKLVRDSGGPILIEDTPPVGGGVTVNNTVFVSKNGNNATGARNDWSKPFLTIQAALAAALAGDTVFIFPGTYAEAVVMPDKDNITIRGAGINAVNIAPVAGVPFTWVIGAALMQKFEMSDLTLTDLFPAGTGCIFIDGNAVADAGASFPGFVFRRVKADCQSTTNAVRIRRVDDVRVYDCNFQGGDFLMQNVGRLWVYNTEVPRLFEHYDVAEVQPFSGRTDHFYIGCGFAGFRWEAHPLITLDHDCIVRGSSTQGVLSIGGGGQVPTLRSRARHETGVTFLTLVAGSIIDYSYAVFTSAARIRLATAGPTRIMALLRNSVLQQDGVGTNRIEGGDFIDYDARNATYTAIFIFFATTGGVNRMGVRRSLDSLQLVGLVIGLNVLPITPQWPPTGAAPVIVVQSRGIAGGAFAVPVKGNDTFTVDSTVVDSVDILIADPSA